MNALPPSPGEPPKQPQGKSFPVYLPGDLRVLRAAVEELLKSSWEKPFRQRALEISCAFEGSFRSSGRDDLAALIHTLVLLLEIKPEEIALLGAALPKRMSELLNHLEEKLSSEGGLKTG